MSSLIVTHGRDSDGVFVDSVEISAYADDGCKIVVRLENSGGKYSAYVQKAASLGPCSARDLTTIADLIIRAKAFWERNLEGK